MKNAIEDPMFVVDDVIIILRQLSAQCHLYSYFMDSPPSNTAALCDVGMMMSLIRDCLDDQIKILDEIEWPKTAEARSA